MSTKTIPVTIVPEDEANKAMLTIATQNNLPADVTQSLHASFFPLFTNARSVIEKSRGITVTSVDQKLEMMLARECRLALRRIRTEGDSTRRQLKEESLRRGKAIDGFFAILVDLTDGEERRLDEQEKFAIRKEEERKAVLKVAREEQLKPYGLDTSFMDLGAMPDETFRLMLDNARAGHEAKIEAARKIEEEQVELENRRLKAIEAQRLENERLKREAIEREEAARQERLRLQAIAEVERQKAAEAKRLADEEAARLKAEADAKLEAQRAEAAERQRKADEMAHQERAALEAQRKKEQDEAFAKAEGIRKKHEADAAEAKRKADAAVKAQQAKVRAEKEAREKAEAELAEAKRAEDARVAARLAEEREKADRAAAAALAPDRTKLTAYVAQVRALTVPALTTEAGKLVATDLSARLEAFAAYCQKKADQL